VSCTCEKGDKFFIPQNARNLLTTIAATSFSSKTSIHEGSVTGVLFKDADSTVSCNIFERLDGIE
jgi:hypothetical protein